jgi:azurin
MEYPSDSAVIFPSTAPACGNPTPNANSSRKQPVSAILRGRLRKARSSFNSNCSVVKRLKVENEENDQILSEKTASSTEENCVEFQESLQHIDSESEESMFLKNIIKDISACESKSLDTGSYSTLQNDFVNESPKQGLKEERAKLVQQIQEKEDLLRRLKLVKMYRSKVRRILQPLHYFYINYRKVTSKISYKFIS